MQHNSWSSVSFAILIAAHVELTDAGSTVPGYDIAKAVAGLAKLNVEVDVQYLSHYLQLPDLRRDLKWQGPSSENEASNFAAFYDPPSSDLGIVKVVLRRQTGATVSLEGKPAELHSLALTLEPGNCPAESTLTDAIGIKATETLMPGYDGGPSYMTKTFFVPQSHGAAVQVTFVDHNTCSLTISHSRPL